MAVTISQAQVKSFEANLRFLAQQSKSHLRQYVYEKNQGSKMHVFPRLGAQTFGAKAGPRTATPANDSVWSNRVTTPATYHGGDSVEPEDAEQMIVEPKSAIQEALARAARRQVDDILIAAASGNAPDEAGTANAFPAGQKLGGPTQAFDFAFITTVNEKFLLNDIDAETEKVFVISPNCVKKMLAMTQFGSRDYTQAQALDAGGVVKNWLGFTWVVSTRLAIPGANQRKLLAFTRRAIGLTVTRDIWARIAEDPSISFATRIYTALSMGAVRVEDEQIVEATILES